MTYEEMQLKRNKFQNDLQIIDDKIDNVFLGLLKRQDLVTDRNRDWGRKINYVPFIYDEFNLLDFDKVMLKLKELFEQRVELRYNQNKLEKDLDVKKIELKIDKDDLSRW